MVVALENGPWKTGIGHTRVFDAGEGGWRNEPTRGRKVDSAWVLLSIPSGVVRDASTQIEWETQPSQIVPVTTGLYL